jgi:hypothetical protein
VSACQFVGYVCLPLHCRNATPLLVTFDLFAENLRLCLAASGMISSAACSRNDTTRRSCGCGKIG